MFSECREWCKASIFQPPSPVGTIQGDTTPLGGTPGTSVDVQLLTLVAESPSRISHTLSVSQWSSRKVGAS